MGTLTDIKVLSLLSRLADALYELSVGENEAAQHMLADVRQEIRKAARQAAPREKGRTQG